MQFCKHHAKRITTQREQLGLVAAKLRLEFKDIDPDSRELDGYVCPLCQNASFFVKDADGVFLLTIQTQAGDAVSAISGAASPGCGRGSEDRGVRFGAIG